MVAETVTLQDAIDDALAMAGLTVAGWALVAGTIEQDGSETLVTEQSQGLTSWARTGMLREALESEGWEFDDEEGTDG